MIENPVDDWALVCVVDKELVKLDRVWLVLVWMLVTISVSSGASVMLCDVDAADEPDCVLVVVVGASVALTNAVPVKYNTA